MSSTDPQGDLRRAIEWARRNSEDPPAPKPTTSRNWLPLIGIALLLVLAGWWWWANYSRPATEPTAKLTTLTDLKQGARVDRKSSRLSVKPNGTVVSE